MFQPKSSAKLTLEEKVQLLLDEKEIRDIHHRYCRSVARADTALSKTCFFPDAIDHHEPFFVETAENLFNAIEASGEPMGLGLGDPVHYIITNLLVEIDGDVAHTEGVVWSAKRLTAEVGGEERPIRIAGGRYLDRFERRNGEWRIAERWFIPEWGTQVDATTGPKFPGQFGKTDLAPIPSLRSPEDISYTFGAGA